MTPRAGRYGAGAAAGIALALSLTACESAGKDTASGGGRPASGGVRLTAAQQTLAEVSSQADGIASFRGTMSFSARAGGRRTETTYRLAVRDRPTRAMRLDVPSADLGGRKTHLTEILAGDRLYLKMPGIEAKVGRPWASVTLDQLSATYGTDLSTMSQGNLSENTTMLTASKDARLLGEARVGGVSTDHYQGTFDLRDGLAKLSGRQRTEAQQSFGAVGFYTMDFDVWVDGRRRPRKLTLTSPPGARTTMTITMTYSAFNVPLAITAPPKSQVADGSRLLAGEGGLPG